MARKGSAAVAAPAAEADTSTEQVETEETTDSTEETVDEGFKNSDGEVVDLAEFIAAVDKALEDRDMTTGVVPDAAIGAVNTVYRAIPGGQKNKNVAKQYLNDQMVEQMSTLEVVKARSYMELVNHLSAATAKATKEKKVREPVNPTEAFVQRVGTLSLAYSLAVAVVPEGVDETWEEAVGEFVAKHNEAAEAYLSWLNTEPAESEEKADAPETDAAAIAAVKLSQGKAAKAGSKVKATGSVHTGPNRSIAKHIEEVFGEKEPGAFLLIQEIANANSAEYGTDHPSSGAVSSRLFPKSGKCTLDASIVVPDTNDKGNKGARKPAA